MYKQCGGSDLASNPGSLFQILSCSFGEKSDFSPKLQDKIWNGEPGFKASSDLQGDVGMLRMVLMAL